MLSIFVSLLSKCFLTAKILLQKDKLHSMNSVTPKKGVYIDTKKNGSPNYRASITYKNKHISLGSFDTASKAAAAYKYAGKIISEAITINDYKDNCPLPFDKFVILLNFRDNNVYFKTPIYLEKRFFFYYFSKNTAYKFDIEDLFFYSEHKIQQRGGHLFVSDYGMQVNIHSRYGIKKHAVLNRDYRFVNDDKYDYRYENIEIINPYFGVLKDFKNNKPNFRVVILFNNEFLVGNYTDETTAAVAYNKAVDVIKRKYPDKKYELNYVEALTPLQYAELYTEISISEKIYKL